jgi:hypothetical protein
VDALDLLLDVVGLALELHDGLGGQAREHAVQRIQQVEQRGGRERQRPRLLVAGDHAALVLEAAMLLARLQGRGRLLELAVLEQALHELVARVDLLLLAGRRRGQEHLRLDAHERRGHDEELPRHVRGRAGA